MMKVQLANPRGFCAGVDRAIEIVTQVLDQFDAPVYVRHEVVHNRFVVNQLKQKGAIFVDELDQVPDGSVVIFSAHGVSQAVQEEAQRRHLQVFDATCPLVTKVHLQVARYCRQAYAVVLIGHRGHPEVEGTMGQYRCPQGKGIYLVETVQDVADLRIEAEKIAFVTQTTLSMDDTAEIITALKQKYPHIQGPKKNDICYATQNRQDAVKQLAQKSDLVLVVGSPNSSNSNRLKEIAEKMGKPAYLIDGAEDLKKEWFHDQQSIAVTAGASAPDVLVQAVIDQLKDWGADQIEEYRPERKEEVTFPLPKSMRQNKGQDSKI